MSQLEELENFVRIVDTGGIGRAAELMGLPKSAVSRRLSSLENRLGVQLIVRTTRRWHLTEAGERCYQHAFRVIDANNQLESSVVSGEQELSGRLRIAAPLSFSNLHLAPVLQNFSEKYPELEMDVQLSDNLINIVEEAVDLTLRIGLMPDSEFRARVIAPISICFVASPEYLAKHGTPKHPRELAEHKVMAYTGGGRQAIKLSNQSGETFEYNQRSSFQCNNGELLNRMAVQGYGIALSPRFLCWKDLEAGRLQPILSDFAILTGYLHALYPANRFTSSKVRVFIDHLVESFGRNVYWEQ